MKKLLFTTKKLLITFSLLIAVILPCFAMTGCTSAKYDGKQYLLEDVIVTYDETVSQEDRAAQDGIVNAAKERIGGENTPFCRFYKRSHTIVTNCHGVLRLAEYEIKSGKIINRIVTNKWDDNGPYEVYYYNPLTIYEYLPGVNDVRLEASNFTFENKKLVLTESKDGITMKYVFKKDGKINESTKATLNKDYSLWAVTLRSYVNDEKTETAAINYYSEIATYAESYLDKLFKSASNINIRFDTETTCKIGNNSFTVEIPRRSDLNKVTLKDGNTQISNDFRIDFQMNIYGNLIELSPYDNIFVKLCYYCY